MATYDEVKLFIKEGDIIKSKFGVLMESFIINKGYLVYELEYLGNGKWKALSEKKEVSSRKNG